MGNTTRRRFLKQAAVAGSALMLGGVAACGKSQNEGGEAPAVISQKKFRWKMVTTWPPHFPVLGEGVDLFARWVEELSGGQLTIHVYGGGELVPALEVFETVSQGIVQLGHGASYYWAGKVPAAQFFSSVPFGMNGQQMNAWLYRGGGLDLWRKVYLPFNVIPFPGGNTGVQMGGWFNKEINSIDDFKGLKMRIPGLGGKVIAKAGGSAILSPGGEIYTNLERGVIDATEWIGPYHDYLMGFHRIARYYYYPGWHEPGSVLELIVNKSAFEQLPAHLKAIIETAAFRLNLWILSEFEAQNAIYLQKIKDEGKVDIRPFPAEVLTTLRQYANEVIEELITRDPLSKEVFQAFQAFKKQIGGWADISEKMYYDAIGVTHAI